MKYISDTNTLLPYDPEEDRDSSNALPVDENGDLEFEFKFETKLYLDLGTSKSAREYLNPYTVGH